MLAGFGGEGSSCLLSHLPWSSLLSGWCCPSLPHVFGVRLSVFFVVFFFYILKRLAHSPLSTPHPRTAVNLSVVTNAAARLPASASAVSLIKRRGPSVPPTRLFCGKIQGWTGAGRMWAPGWVVGVRLSPGRPSEAAPPPGELAGLPGR